MILIEKIMKLLGKYQNKLSQVTHQFNGKIQEQININNELKREMNRKILNMKIK